MTLRVCSLRLFFLLMFCISVSVKASDFDAVRQLAERRAPWLSPYLTLIKTESKAKDSFSLESKGSQLIISASSDNAAAMGLGWYLRYYAHRSMSHLGDNLSAPDTISVVPKKITITSEVAYRYALNYCTISYSMANYTWTDWERELDWMALHGVNLMLAPVGMEAVWQNTLLRLSYTKEETKDFLAHPAYSAWWLMGNLEGWGGPVSDAVIHQQANLQKKILARMASLGIEPVMHGFYGMVPRSLKEKHPLQTTPQGKWAGGFDRPDFLSPNDPMFSQIASIYYEEIKKLYGNNLKFFGGDPFHEGGQHGDIDIADAGKNIQIAMQKAFPKSTWILQGWHDNPSRTLLSKLDKQHVLVIELFGENSSNWEARQAYDGTPFVWCNVSNFGEKTGLYGKLQRFSDEVARIKTSEYAPYLQGIGIIPEGINNNPITYDFTLELAWHSTPPMASEWVKNYVQYRYGESNDLLLNAWNIFIQTIYSSPAKHFEGPPESVFCARPAWGLKSVSSWGRRERGYDTELFAKGVHLFLEAERKISPTETYFADKTDLMRQLIANQGEEVYAQMEEAVKNGNVAQFEQLSQHFLSLIQQQEEVLQSNPFFRLDYWLNKGNDFGQTEADKQQAIRNTKMQITIWGHDSNPNTNLRDYAHKEWAGLMGTLYYNRWQLFCEQELRRLKGEPTESIDFFEMEKAWSSGKE